ncbi:MAG: hypothetical protein RMJ35_12045 [Phycisphaerales bacterium]|nr:hypothetical protein [Phycisphaerales bacterium]
MSRLSSFAMVLALVAGCSRFGYRITHPPDWPQTIGFDEDLVLRTSAGEYRLRAAGQRLVLRIFNDSHDELILDGQRSTVTAPDGSIRPIPGCTIAPKQLAKLFFPPKRPPAQPRVGGIQFGVYASSGVYRDWNAGRADHDWPASDHKGVGISAAVGSERDSASRGDSLNDPSHPAYWDWKGLGSIKLRLVYRRGSHFLEDQFEIQRVRVP